MSLRKAFMMFWLGVTLRPVNLTLLLLNVTLLLLNVTRKW